MYTYKKRIPTQIKSYNVDEGETIEQKVDRVTTNKEPIKDGAPIIHTDRKDGVQPGYNIRTDRWDTALDAMDLISKSRTAKREQKMEIVKDDKDDEVEPIHGTDNQK